MNELDRVQELDKLIPAAKKEAAEKQSAYQLLLNERERILKDIIQCTKVRFPNKAKANKRMKALIKKGLIVGSVYHCQRCLGWHLTSRKD